MNLRAVASGELLVDVSCNMELLDMFYSKPSARKYTSRGLGLPKLKQCNGRSSTLQRSLQQFDAGRHRCLRGAKHGPKTKPSQNDVSSYLT